MHLGIGTTSIINVFLMPSSNQTLIHSPFQGFLAELMNQGYHSALTLVPLYPQDAIEIFFSQEKLIEFRCNISDPNYLFVSPESAVEILQTLKDHPFIFITYLPSEEYSVKSIVSEFKYSPITISTDSCAQINLGDDFSIFSFDSLIKSRFEEIRNTTLLPEEITRLLENYSPRKNWKIQQDDWVSRAHGVTQATEAALVSLGFQFNDVRLIPGSFDKGEYIDAMVNIAEKMLSKLPRIKAGNKSDLIIYSPSIFAHQYKFNSQWWNQILRLIKDKKAKRFLLDAVLKNPAYSGASFEVDDSAPLPFKNDVVREVLSIRKFELPFTVMGIQCLRISNCSPALRLPNSINFHVSKVKELESLYASYKPKSQANFKEKLGTYLETLKDEIGKKLQNFVEKNADSLTLCTDVPIEWVRFGKVPLMFSHEISKIHTTPGNQFLMQATRSTTLSMHKDDFQHVTVIRSFKSNDPLRKILEAGLKHYIEIDNTVELNIIDVSSKAEFINALKDNEAPILIIDCHGNHGGSEANGWLQIGEDKVDTWFLPCKGELPPIVILSSCLTAALAGSHASVANGFLNLGAITVIGTLLPVDGLKSAAFVGRIIYRLTGFLNALSALDVQYITWREFMTGFLRMSFITDLLILMKSTFINHEQYMEAHSKANYFINLGLKDWFEKTVELISEIAQVELDILYAFIDSIVFTETMCYSQIGRPETILINLE